MIKRFLFQLDHPAHYHLFRNTIKVLKEKGHEVHVSIKEKDILKNLLSGEEYFSISDNYRKKNIPSILRSVLIRDYRLFKLVKKLKPDVMVGTSPEIGHIRKFVNSQAIFFGEDDVNLSFMMYLAAFSCYPFFDSVVSPFGCDNRIWNKKTIFYNGFQKLAYLHHNHFAPDRSKVDVPDKERFFILRLAKLAAYHDMNAVGITNNIALKLIQLLEPYGRVIISNEREIPAELERHLFKGNPNDFHHYLYFADLYIGDSQSMAVEAAMLGIPGIRFNSFAGKITILKELEHKYGLTSGIKPDKPEKLYQKVSELISDNNIKEEFQKRRRKMLEDKIDVSAFMVWFIENFPESRRIMQENPEYSDRFK